MTMGESVETCSELAILSISDTDDKSWSLLSEESTSICQWIIFTVLCQTIDIFGIVTNIINIICFVKQGFKDPVNISLLGLALADLGCLITLIWTNICYTPAFTERDLPFDTIEFQYLTSGMPHTTFTRVSGWITAIITMERCLCISAPLKVRSIVTPKRVSIVIACIFIILVSSVAPLYIVNKLDMKFFPLRNKTVLGIIPTSNRESVEKISFAINNIFIPFGAFSVITICTIILVIKIQKRSKWRTKSTTAAQGDKLSNRNQKVAKMVIMISTLFIVCFIPLCLLFAAMVTEPELSIDGKYKNWVILYGGLCFVLESINSSANIIIYFNMSSKYRRYFRDMFCYQQDRNNVYDDS